MVARVNGQEYSRATLADIFWSFGEMLAYASRGTEIVPGDVIGSGTCGTGCILELSLVHGPEAYPWLDPGDIVTLEADHPGQIPSRVLDAPGRGGAGRAAGAASSLRAGADRSRSSVGHRGRTEDARPHAVERDRRTAASIAAPAGDVQRRRMGAPGSTCHAGDHGHAGHPGPI